MICHEEGHHGTVKRFDKITQSHGTPGVFCGKRGDSIGKYQGKVSFSGREPEHPAPALHRAGGISGHAPGGSIPEAENSGQGVGSQRHAYGIRRCFYPQGSCGLPGAAGYGPCGPAPAQLHRPHAHRRRGPSAFRHDSGKSGGKTPGRPNQPGTSPAAAEHRQHGRRRKIPIPGGFPQGNPGH